MELAVVVELGFDPFFDSELQEAFELHTGFGFRVSGGG